MKMSNLLLLSLFLLIHKVWTVPEPSDSKPKDAWFLPLLAPIIGDMASNFVKAFTPRTTMIHDGTILTSTPSPTAARQPYISTLSKRQKMHDTLQKLLYGALQEEEDEEHYPDSLDEQDSSSTQDDVNNDSLTRKKRESGTENMFENVTKGDNSTDDNDYGMEEDSELEPTLATDEDKKDGFQQRRRNKGRRGNRRCPTSRIKQTTTISSRRSTCPVCHTCPGTVSKLYPMASHDNGFFATTDEELDVDEPDY